MATQGFATVDGYQDKIKLRDRIWIDETYVPDNSILRGSDWAPKRGLSKDQTCIAVAIDIHKNMVAVVCGNGKPSSKRIKNALLEHIQEGSVIVHDKERAHNSLVKARKLQNVRMNHIRPISRIPSTSSAWNLSTTYAHG